MDVSTEIRKGITDCLESLISKSKSLKKIDLEFYRCSTEEAESLANAISSSDCLETLTSVPTFYENICADDDVHDALCEVV